MMIIENSKYESFVSIVIVCLNEGERLRHCLKSIEELDFPRDKLEVVIVDNGSTDNTCDIIKEFDVNFFSVPGKNIPTLRNIGVRESKGRIIAFVDGDCLVSKNWLKTALPYFNKYGDVLVGSPAVVPDNGNWVEKGWDLHWQRKCQSLEEPFDGNMVTAKEPERLITTANLLMTKTVYEIVGGFDEELATGEDYVFCYTAGRKGVRTFSDRRIKVTHLGAPKSLLEFFEEELWHSSNRNTNIISRLFRKNGGGGRNPLLFAVYYVLSILGLLITVPWAIFHSPFPLFLNVLIPVSASTLLALRTAVATRNIRYTPVLFLLYSAYGIARAINITNLFKIKVKKRKSKLTSV